MKLSTTLRLMLLGVSLVSINVHSAPLIAIGSMYEIINSEQRSLTKRVYNNGDTSAFVKVEVMKIDPNSSGPENPVKALQEEQLVKDRLLVTPMRMIIPPNNFQNSRILWSGVREKEQYYRVRYTPVLPGKGDTFGLDEKAISDYRAETIKAGVNVLAGYGTVVIVHPDKPEFKTDIGMNANSVNISNKGNATVVLEDIRNCKSTTSQCDASARAVILPGRSHILKKYTGGTVTFALQEGSQRRTMKY